jgi:polyphosphate kinase
MDQNNNNFKPEESPRFVHRDLSWLSFNARVLQEAKDKQNPLLERVKFLAIYSKNLGEFYHVRMAYHLNLIRINKSTRKKLDYSPKMLIKKITNIVNQQQNEFTRIFNYEIKPELADNQINIKNLDSISDSQRNFLQDNFNDTLRLLM